MTMLSLTLLRHAKAVPAIPEEEDANRPLLELGRRQSIAVRQAVAGEAVPELVYCSPSLRTCQTLDIVAAVWSPMPPVRYEDALYLASPATILKLIRTTPPEIRRLWVVGHNPGLATVVMALSAEVERDRIRGDRFAGEFPTAARARFDFAGDDWGALTELPVQGVLLARA